MIRLAPLFAAAAASTLALGSITTAALPVSGTATWTAVPVSVVALVTLTAMPSLVTQSDRNLRRAVAYGSTFRKGIAVNAVLLHFR